MTRRKSKQPKREPVDRKGRITRLIAAGMISNESEIPPDAIPVEPALINRGGSYFCPIFYQDVNFLCTDCGVSQTWKADDQRWYYETTNAAYYSIAKRCRECRKKEKLRIQLARRSAGHDSSE
jgi:hypothetical protein